METIKGFYALEGLDGVGKSTVRDLLEMEGLAIFRTPPEEFKKFRNVFDNQDLRVRFLFYLASVIKVGVDIKDLRVREETVDVVCDRYLLSTIASHEAMGMNGDFLALMMPIVNSVPKPEKMFLLVAEEDVRIRRMLERGANDNDIKNLKINSKLLVGYRKWAKQFNYDLVEIDTTSLSKEDVRDEIINQIKENE